MGGNLTSHPNVEDLQKTKKFYFSFDPTSDHKGDNNSLSPVPPKMSANLDAKLEAMLSKLEKLDAVSKFQ